MSPAATEILDGTEILDDIGLAREAVPSLFEEVTIANFPNHAEAEAAVRRLSAGGVPVTQISIIGRHFEAHEEIQGFYRPVDVALAGAGQGAWYGGLFGLLLGAFGFFVLPLVGGLVNRHGGCIWLDSVVGVGSTFYFTLDHSKTSS